MRTLPTTMIQVLVPFTPLFSKSVWWHARVLVAGAILAPGRRTVASTLRAVGLEDEGRFCRYHRVLSRAVWSSKQASRILLELLMKAFVAEEAPLVVGVDETLERRWRKNIEAKGIYRDPVRSSHSHFVKTSALRWVCVTLLLEIPWASRVWALPFLSALAPSDRYDAEHGKRHKSITEWAWQLLLLIRSWHPGREIVAVAEGGYASLKLLDRCRRLREPITFITRLRLDAALYEPAPPRYSGQMGRPRLKGERLPNLSTVAEDPDAVWSPPITVADWYGGQERTVEIISKSAVWYSTGLPAVPLRWVLIRDPEKLFETQALLCTDLSAESERILSWFVRRWRMEATFQLVATISHNDLEVGVRYPHAKVEFFVCIAIDFGCARKGLKYLIAYAFFADVARGIVKCCGSAPDHAASFSSFPSANPPFTNSAPALTSATK
jgi:hypothetical protein